MAHWWFASQRESDPSTFRPSNPPLPLLIEKYAESWDGVLGCYDRIVITDSLAELCYAKGMTHYLYAYEIRIFEYARWAEPLLAEIRANAEAVAQAANLTIEYISKKSFRKEDRIQALQAERGAQPGLGHIFSAIEPCASYRPWHDKAAVTPISSPTTVAAVSNRPKLRTE